MKKKIKKQQQQLNGEKENQNSSRLWSRCHNNNALCIYFSEAMQNRAPYVRTFSNSSRCLSHFYSKFLSHTDTYTHIIPTTTTTTTVAAAAAAATTATCIMALFIRYAFALFARNDKSEWT